ncbi:endonuclease domain-containing 1 protein-like [Brachyhypopomus gauderio]|uniref:endonuclease domain-containing 1 protein-like n=1 Tax=Brachyhypopomus gauderio TaxID=698409 RepID=UPI0040427D93
MEDADSGSLAQAQFFATPNGVAKPPTVLPGTQYKQICQKQATQNVYEFATLYDTANRIPVYSAYTFIAHKACDRSNRWDIEPQLDDQNKGPDMQPDADKTLKKPPRGNNQSLNEDYAGSGYHRGHLYPVYQTNTQCTADSTFTLTNAAPQNPSFNVIQWRILERDVAMFLTSQCLPNRAYMVTGVVPNTAGQKINNRVNIPSYFWSAYCCLDNNNKNITSGGYFSPNSNQQPSGITVSNLETNLSNHYGPGFVLFGGVC